MNWKKIGSIFSPSGEFPWMLSHASTPFGKFIDKNLLRIYFTCRDNKNRSHISFLDLDMRSLKVEYIADSPVLKPGNLGLFDDSGVAMGFIIEFGGNELLYYLGWNLKVTVPWLNTIGLAIKNPATGEFEKYSRAPVLDRSEEDPYSISYPSILLENGMLKMWYGSHLVWGESTSDMLHVIKYAESYDSISWKRSKEISVNVQQPEEIALSRPCVLKDPDIYRMWYCYRGLHHNYTIGYSESIDGLTWIRKDTQAGIGISKNGWDSEMVCYPFVFDYDGHRYMLYNGNGFGSTGFGIAILEN